MIWWQSLPLQLTSPKSAANAQLIVMVIRQDGHRGHKTTLGRSGEHSKLCHLCSPRTPAAKKKKKSFSGPFMTMTMLDVRESRDRGLCLGVGVGMVAPPVCLYSCLFAAVFLLQVRWLFAPVGSDRHKVPATPDEHDMIPAQPYELITRT